VSLFIATILQASRAGGSSLALPSRTLGDRKSDSEVLPEGPYHHPREMVLVQVRWERLAAIGTTAGEGSSHVLGTGRIAGIRTDPPRRKRGESGGQWHRNRDAIDTGGRRAGRRRGGLRRT